MTDFEVAVLGGGIAGCLAACMLADAGRSVVIVEQRAQLMDGASRWNDGKIHLGYTFTGTDSLSTAALMQEGAATFIPILESVLGRTLDELLFGPPVTYIVDENSLFDPDTLFSRAQQVAGLLDSSLQRLPGLSRWMDGPLLQRLDPDQASASTHQSRIAAAWRTSERHISAGEVAALVRTAVAQRDITVIHDRVEGVAEGRSGWTTKVSRGTALSSSVAVNCLWEGMAVIDRQVVPDEPTDPAVVIRYKHALFGTNTSLQTKLQPSTRILGKFGDVATLANGDAYLSWYPAGLAGRSDDGIPPTVGPIDPDRLIFETLNGLDLPASLVDEPGARWEVRGGYVVARGDGDIDQQRSLLHRRDRARVAELRPGFISVDTGKYTTGPLMAKRAVDLALRHLE